VTPYSGAVQERMQQSSHPTAELHATGTRQLVLKETIYHAHVRPIPNP